MFNIFNFILDYLTSIMSYCVNMGLTLVKGVVLDFNVFRILSLNSFKFIFSYLTSTSYVSFSRINSLNQSCSWYISIRHRFKLLNRTALLLRYCLERCNRSFFLILLLYSFVLLFGNNFRWFLDSLLLSWKVLLRTWFRNSLNWVQIVRVFVY